MAAVPSSTLAAPRAASVWLSDFPDACASAAGHFVLRSLTSTEKPGADVQRLKTRAQFDAVMAGATVSRTAHFALHRSALHQPERPPQVVQDGSPALAPWKTAALFGVDDVWIGAMLPKRWAKRAVTRNAIKRQIYNVCDDLASSMPRAAHVVRLRSAFDRATFISATSIELKRAVRAELERLLQQAAAGIPASMSRSRSAQGGA